MCDLTQTCSGKFSTHRFIQAVHGMFDGERAVNDQDKTKRNITQSHKTESARASWVNMGCMLSTWRRIPLQAFVFCLGSWRRVQLQSLSHRVEVKAEVLLPPGGRRCTCSGTLDAASGDDPPPAPFVRCLVGEDVVCL